MSLKCKFCNAEIEVTDQPQHDTRTCDCPVCGKYILIDTAFELQLNCSQDDAILFSGVLRNRPNADRKKTINSNDLKRIPDIVASYRALSVTDKIENLIRYIAKNSKHLGHKVPISKFVDYTKFYCYNREELVGMIDYLRSRSFIISEEDNEAIKSSLTVDGWKEYEKLKEVNFNSKNVFIAMNFDKEFDEIYKKAILPACKKCKFKATRVDKIEHNEKICDRIISEIRQSKFIISDFTGQKHGVYFEAGYAQGLGIHVIFTCRKNEIEDKKIHFDTRQYNYIAWESIDDLKQRLIERIKATI